jgi:hypothetical protein
VKAKTERRLLGLKTISNQARKKIDQEIERAAVTSMLNPRNIFELVIDGLDNGAFAHEDFVFEQHETVPHIFAKFGDELKGVLVEKLQEECLGQIAFIAKQLAEEGLGKLWNWHVVIDITSCLAAGQQFATIIGDDMQFEAVEPAQRVFAMPCQALKYTMGMNTLVVHTASVGESI